MRSITVSPRRRVDGIRLFTRPEAEVHTIYVMQGESAVVAATLATDQDGCRSDCWIRFESPAFGHCEALASASAPCHGDPEIEALRSAAEQVGLFFSPSIGVHGLVLAAAAQLGALPETLSVWDGD